MLEKRKDRDECEKRKITAFFMSVLLAVSFVVGCAQKEEIPADTQAVQEEEATEEEKEDTEDTEDTEEGEQTAPIKIDTTIPVEKGAQIAVVAKSTTGEFWENVKKGMEDCVSYLNEAYGFKGKDRITMTFEGPDGAEELTDLINTVDAVLAENPSVLCLAAGDENAGEAQLETARDNNIPVILFDSVVDVAEDLYTAYCGTDDRRMGEEAAHRLMEAMGGTGKAALISHWNSDQTSIDRVKGFKEGLHEKEANVELVSEITLQEGGNLQEEIQRLLEENPDLSGVFCTNIDVAAAALDALDSMKTEGLKVVGVDGSSRQIEAIRKGEEVGVISQNPYLMGFRTIYAAAQASCGSTVNSEKNIYIDYAWLDASNLEDEAMKPYIYK